MADSFPNVFEHQRFRVRTPDGERLGRSFRELVTATAADGSALDPDEALALDYPQEYLNAAALGLLSFLAQVAFEPDGPRDLAARLRTPLSADAYEAAVGPLRAHFRVDGEGARFMQGRPPAAADVKKATRPVDSMLLSVPAPANHLTDKEFLNRVPARLAIAPDQAGLLCFSRNTFYEGTGGKGFQKGVNGDTPVRTLVTDPAAGPAAGDTLRLRRSLWLNVLTAEAQLAFPARYARPGDAAAYDGRFWESPPEGAVALGRITLRAALGWMSATHWLLFGEAAEPHICAVTGEALSGRLATHVVKQSTGVPFGTKGDLDAGERSDRLFYHPNVPLQKVRDRKTGEVTGDRAYNVDRTRGLAEAVGASFFASGASGYAEPAPAVVQLSAREIKREVRAPRLAVFGFHMLSGQKNVHGGFEVDTFRFALPDPDGAADADERMREAAGLLHAATEYADRVAYALGSAVQMASGAGVRAPDEANESGRPSVSARPPEARKTTDGRGFSGDALARFWRAVQRGEPGARAPVADGLHGLVERLAAVAGDGDAYKSDAGRAVRGDWEASVRAWALRVFADAAAPYRTAPRTLPLVPVAERMLRSALRKHATQGTAPAEPPIPLPDTQTSLPF